MYYKDEHYLYEPDYKIGTFLKSDEIKLTVVILEPIWNTMLKEYEYLSVTDAGEPEAVISSEFLREFNFYIVYEPT